MDITKVKETCLYATDLIAAREFYGDKLEFELISFVENRHIFYRIGESVLLIFNPEVTKNEKELPPHFAYGPMHIAFEVDVEGYDSSKQKCLQKGIKITHIQDWKSGRLESFYFEDPAGNILEIVPSGLWD